MGGGYYWKDWSRFARGWVGACFCAILLVPMMQPGIALSLRSFTFNVSSSYPIVRYDINLARLSNKVLVHGNQTSY